MFCTEFNPNHFSFLIDGDYDTLKEIIDSARLKAAELNLLNFPNNTSIFDKYRNNMKF